MARSALLSISDNLKERTYTYEYDGEEYEYTFRVLPVKDVLVLQENVDKLRSIRAGSKVTKKQRDELFDVFVDLVKRLYVPTDEEKELGLVMDGEVAFRFMMQAGGEDFFNSELLKNITFHLVGREVSDDEIENLESALERETKKDKKKQ